MTESVRPARPHTGFTEDGRKMQVVTTYTRRGSRLTPRQQAAWDAHSREWLIPDEAVDAPDFSWRRYFDRDRPLAVEIGCGIGEATAAMALEHPEWNIVGFEVWRPGVAETFRRLEEVGVSNVRMMSVDAVWCLEHLVAPDSLVELRTFFPDPWPKKRHHRRRMVNPAFTKVVACALSEGAIWRLATDWPEYAVSMQEALDAEPGLQGGPVERFEGRPLTKFERRGIAEGRAIVDFAYRACR